MNKLLYILLVHTPLLYYSASFVIMKVYNWYLPELFGTTMTQLQALGLALVVGLLTFKGHKDDDSELTDFVSKSLTNIISYWIVLLTAFIILKLFG